MAIFVLILTAWADTDSMIKPEDLLPPGVEAVRRAPLARRGEIPTVAESPFACDYCQRVLEYRNLGEPPFRAAPAKPTE